MIRDYRPSDLQALREITMICFEGTSIDQNIEARFGKIGDTDWRMRKAKHIDADARANPQGIFVYEVDGTIVGFITCALDPETRVGSIPNLAVLPAHQQKGIGKELLVKALDHLESRNVLLVRIEALDQNAVGPDYYPRIGFQKVATQIHYAMPIADRRI